MATKSTATHLRPWNLARGSKVVDHGGNQPPFIDERRMDIFPKTEHESILKQIQL